jgi:hypothetical protein
MISGSNDILTSPNGNHHGIFNIATYLNFNDQNAFHHNIGTLNLICVIAFCNRHCAYNQTQEDMMRFDHFMCTKAPHAKSNYKDKIS